MKIISYEEKENKLKIMTDNPDYDVFVYPVGRFSKVEDLKREIEKKTKEIENRDRKRAEKKTNIIKELDAEIKKNA